MFTHLVLFKLKDPTSANLHQTRDLLLSMQGQVPQLRFIEVGLNSLPSDRAYDLALLTRFDTLDDMRAYQVHPYHKDVVLPHMHAVVQNTVSVDYDA